MISPSEASIGRAEAVAAAALRNLATRQAEMARLLGELVEIESGSDDLTGLQTMAGRLRELFGEFGDIARFPARSPGVENLVLTVPGCDRSEPHVAVLGHYDTVWPRGTLQRMPFGIDERGIARGPGCFD